MLIDLSEKNVELLDNIKKFMILKENYRDKFSSKQEPSYNEAFNRLFAEANTSKKFEEWLNGLEKLKNKKILIKEKKEDSK